MKNFYVRKIIRLKGYDYSKSGRYFVTICVKDRHELLWEPHIGARVTLPPLSDIGKIIEKAIDNIPHISI